MSIVNAHPIFTHDIPTNIFKVTQLTVIRFDFKNDPLNSYDKRGRPYWHAEGVLPLPDGMVRDNHERLIQVPGSPN